MQFACNKCHKTFDERTQQSICPHKLFPSLCDLHDRFNCGNPECDRDFVNIELEKLANKSRRS